MEELPMEKLVASLRCAVCGQHYHVRELKVLGRRDEMWYLNVHCTSCGSRGMMAVAFKESRGHKAATELSSDEQKQFFDAAAISGEDILDVHDFLNGFDGDFRRIFAQK
ncbi:MAG: hypothetical protein HY671_02405 [Chloroflexi bacterium]|nr:hypothetical protein [Chloroflexota bacterium]